MPKQVEKFINISEKIMIPALLMILSYLLNSFSSQVENLRREIKEISALTMENKTELAILKIRVAFSNADKATPTQKQ